MRRLILAITLFVTVCAMSGAIALIAAGSGTASIPHELLARTPFATFVIPGLLLGLVVGGAALVAALASWRRMRGAAELTLLAGGALVVWTAVETVLIPTSWLQGVFGALGLALLALGLAEARTRRARWLIAVTIAETIGYLAPALAGILTTRAGWSDGPRAIAVTTAGLFEGFALGFGQALVLPVPVRRWRYALLTALGAAAVWGLVMGLMAAAPALMPVAAVGLVAIGGAQWLELRARSWIGWTALAWVLALPLSFAPGPFVDEHTPLGPQLVLWTAGGALMALVMALVTWQGARRLRSA